VLEDVLDDVDEVLEDVLDDVDEVLEDVDEVLEDVLPLPPGHVVPPASQPVPQLTAWQW
jgi:hypothetical protein